jgi:hypothetical protein
VNKGIYNEQFFVILFQTIQNEDSSGKTVNKSLAAVVTGKVTSVDGEWHFVHLPEMLQKMLNDTGMLQTLQ